MGELMVTRKAKDTVLCFWRPQSATGSSCFWCIAFELNTGYPDENKIKRAFQAEFFYSSDVLEGWLLVLF